MSARVRIESGIAAGTSYWIDRPVLRVGSDPQCEICVPSADLAPHALTLEFRAGIYRAYNRGTEPISLRQSLLQPGDFGEWEAGDTLVLPGGLKLALAIEGDPRPSPRPDAPPNDGFDESETAVGESAAAVAASPDAAQKARSKSMLQLGVILACVLAMGGLLYFNTTGGFTTAPTANRPNFNSIVANSLHKGPNTRQLVERLQYAQSFVVRGNHEQARLRFAELRDQLVGQIDSLPPEDKKDAVVIRDFVEMQLGQLH